MMKKVFEFNEDQKEAINSVEPKILCLAGAGAGKTACLVNRVHRIATEQNSGDPILVLTFTNAAAFEMSERYKKLTTKNLPLFCTFHAFCYRTIVKDPRVLHAIEYFKIPSIATDSQIRRIVVQCSAALKLKLSEKSATKLISETNSNLSYDFKLFQKMVRKELVKQNIISFDLLSNLVCQLFVSDAEVVRKYKCQYKYIFVDEFQDTDNTQWQFVQSFEPYKANLFVVGDALQALYAFRGADSRIIKALSNNEEWHRIKLKNNYRSTRQICDYANNFAKSYASDEYRVEMQTERLGAEVTKTDIVDNQFSSVYALEKILPDIQDTEKTCAILVSTNKEVNEIKQQLDSAKILYASNSISKDIINLLNSVLSDDTALSWLSSLLPNDKFIQYIQVSTIDNISLTKFANIYKDIYPINLYYNKIMRIRRYRDKPSGMAIASSIASLLGLNMIIPVSDDAKFEEIVNQIIKMCEEREQCRIYVGTIHSSKGLEYDDVAVCGVDSYSFRLSGEDKNNMYYVACTRAKSRLTIVYGDVI